MVIATEVKDLSDKEVFNIVQWLNQCGVNLDSTCYNGIVNAVETNIQRFKIAERERFAEEFRARARNMLSK